MADDQIAALPEMSLQAPHHFDPILVREIDEHVAKKNDINVAVYGIGLSIRLRCANFTLPRSSGTMRTLSCSVGVIACMK